MSEFAAADELAHLLIFALRRGLRHTPREPDLDLVLMARRYNRLRERSATEIHGRTRMA
ncbi:hypothetical protein [Paraburkholderia terrae]|uniref:hypothetical protein n=1 Tax=Paraburkholderia terrae TaxID=311230 RepID=UPI000A5A50DF|nr:hypothetical protein [Paraburkholderia terrae]